MTFGTQGSRRPEKTPLLKRRWDLEGEEGSIYIKGHGFENRRFSCRRISARAVVNVSDRVSGIRAGSVYASSYASAPDCLARPSTYTDRVRARERESERDTVEEIVRCDKEGVMEHRTYRRDEGGGTTMGGGRETKRGHGQPPTRLPIYPSNLYTYIYISI